MNFLSVVLLSHNAYSSALHQMNNGKVERIVVELLPLWSLFTLVFIMCLTQSIYLRDKVPSPRAITWWPPSTGADGLVLSRPIFKGEDHSKESEPPSI